MSFLDSIKSFVSPAPLGEPSTGFQAPAPQGQQPAPQGVSTNNAGTNGGNEGTNQQTTNPLDAYAKMFDNSLKAPEAPPSFNLDPATLDSVTGSMDFLKGINPEIVARAKGGDTEAIFEMMNASNRNAYRAAMEHGSKLTDKFVGMRDDFNGKGLSGRVREELTINAISGDGKATHPVVRQQLKEIATKLQRDNPDASPQQIADAAKKYVSDLNSAINPSASQESSKPASKEVDWDKWF